MIRILVAAVMLLGFAPMSAHAEGGGDISGAWSGSYVQQFDGGQTQAVPFVANINARGAAFTGMTREPNRTNTDNAAMFAVVTGRMGADGSIGFTKTYGTGGWTHGVEYAGHFVSPDRIEGTWRIGEAGGPFSMTRD